LSQLCSEVTKSRLMEVSSGHCSPRGSADRVFILVIRCVSSSPTLSLLPRPRPRSAFHVSYGCTNRIVSLILADPAGAQDLLLFPIDSPQRGLCCSSLVSDLIHFITTFERAGLGKLNFVSSVNLRWKAFRRLFLSLRRSTLLPDSLGEGGISLSLWHTRSIGVLGTGVSIVSQQVFGQAMPWVERFCGQSRAWTRRRQATRIATFLLPDAAVKHRRLLLMGISGGQHGPPPVRLVTGSGRRAALISVVLLAGVTPKDVAYGYTRVVVGALVVFFQNSDLFAAAFFSDWC